MFTTLHIHWQVLHAFGPFIWGLIEWVREGQQVLPARHGWGTVYREYAKGDKCDSVAEASLMTNEILWKRRPIIQGNFIPPWLIQNGIKTILILWTLTFNELFTYSEIDIPKSELTTDELDMHISTRRSQNKKIWPSHNRAS
jgi:hypothetical protein